ncbi:MAG: hypothetical protein JRC86_09945, partial [Deltaproteobacteria bacterium]|nr:hypothetical protein [Deltaproteobacteria bacterium]
FTLDSFLSDTESDFSAFGVVDNPYYNYINTIARMIPGGANIIGALDEKAKTLWKQAGVNPDHILAPGNREVSYGDGEMFKVGLGLPIDYDVWYMFFAGNILLKGRHSDYEEDEWIEKALEKMKDYIKEIDDTETLKALKQPVKEEAKSAVVNFSGGTANGFSGMSGGTLSTDINDGWRFAIKEARFETMVVPYGIGVSPLLDEWTATDGPYFASKEGVYDSTINRPSPSYGPKEPDSDAYCGYIAFPVGPLGVMWSISLATESSLKEETGGTNVYPIHPVDYETKVVQGGELLPPFELVQSETPGEKLIKKGYLVVDNSVVELTTNEFEGIDNPPLHQWLRYWIRADNTMIIPGEFVGMLCRPWPLHCWWYQESTPFIYAGSWIETEFYTSGVVKSVLEPWQYENYEERTPEMPTQDDEAEEAYYDPHEEAMDFRLGAKLYRVWVKNEEIIVASSDWKEYEAGERVGLLKCVRDEGDDAHISAAGAVDAMAGTSDKFSWESLKWFVLKGKDTDDKDIFTKEWVIIPVDFFGIAGNSVGGA